MDKLSKKRILIAVLLIIVINFLVIFFNIKSGISKGDIMFRFREHEAVTFLSALSLGLISLISLAVYFIKKRKKPIIEKYGFWLYSAIGFFYLCMDEYFMVHEGMDEGIGVLFGRDIKEMNLDGLVIAFFGLVALGVCFYFRKAIFKHKIMLPFLILGGIFLGGTVICHLLERIHIYVEVAEESCKIIGVSLFFAAYWLVFLEVLDDSCIVRHNTTG